MSFTRPVLHAERQTIYEDHNRSGHVLGEMHKVSLITDPLAEIPTFHVSEKGKNIDEKVNLLSQIFQGKSAIK